LPKQNVALELYYDSAWNDVAAAAEVFTEDPIVIKRGQSDEGSAFRPCSITCQLNNATDKYRTSNPVSPLYGKAGRNTPMRVKVGGTVRGVVEASSWAADQTQDFRATPRRGKAWVDVEGGGLLQRVGQWTENISSTMVKGMRSFGSDLVGAWPLEDASTATILSNLVAGGAPGGFSDVTLGDSERPAGSARSVKLGSAGHIFGTCSGSAASGWQISFAFKLPALPGSAAYEEIFTWYDSTGRRWTWEVNNANYGWTVYAADGSTVLASLASSYAGEEPNQWIRVKMKATVSGSTVTYEPSWYAEGGTSEVGSSGTFSDTATGYLTRWGATAATYNVGAWYTGVFGIDDATDPLFNTGVKADFNGHAGETAGDRFTRLCDDLGLSYTVLGDSDLSAAMGGQPEATFSDLLKEIVSTDDALLYDDIDGVALVLKLRNDRYNQTPALDLSPTDLPGLPVEVTDDLGVHNIVTASQRDGGDSTAEDSTGPLGTQPPPDGAGEYRQTVDVNVYDEAADLPQQANWWLRRGTVNLPRFPQVTIDLGAKPSLITAVEAVDVGSVITITGFREYTIRLYVLGWTETIGTHTRTITFTCAPDQQFVVGEYDAGTSRYDLRTATLSGAWTSTQAAGTFQMTADESWSTTSEPYDLMIAGEQITVTNMNARTGTGPYFQSANVTRSVNGIVKALTSGAEVHIATPGRWAL
jgi:hypothetical protein